ncbi:MAG: rhomboid family intramembrane serine protease [Mycobacterium sp.]
MSFPPYPPQSPIPGAAPGCYRHADRSSYVQCLRCHRFACAECMRSAPVGYQCVDCAYAGVGGVHQPQPQPQPRARAVSGAVFEPGKPVITYGLIAVNVLMFVLQLASVSLQRELVLWPPAVAEGQWYRLVTSAFMHYGIAHLLFNMWALYIIGPPLETLLGRLRFGALYALSALGGSVLVYLLSALSDATAGASGAIFGLFGATFIVARRLNLDVRWLVGLIVLNLALTFAAPLVIGQAISWQGHVGGLVTGLFITAAYVYAPRAYRNQVQVGISVATFVVFVLLAYWRTAELVATYGGLLHR